MTPAEMLRRLLLLAVQDGAERYLFRPVDGYDCELVAWVGGEPFEFVPPPTEDLQAFPKELARLEAPVGRRCRLARWFGRLRSGVQSGAFRYAVGRGSVRVGYRVRWRKRVVSELELTFGPAPELAEVARQELCSMSPPSSIVE
jgi:hypothetical protein